MKAPYGNKGMLRYYSSSMYSSLLMSIEQLEQNSNKPHLLFLTFVILFRSEIHPNTEALPVHVDFKLKCTSMGYIWLPNVNPGHFTDVTKFLVLFSLFLQQYRLVQSLAPKARSHSSAEVKIFNALSKPFH